MLIQIVSVIQDELVGTSCLTLPSLPSCITSVLFVKGNLTLPSCITSVLFVKGNPILPSCVTAVIVNGYPVIQEELVGRSCYKLPKLSTLPFCITFQIR